MSETTKKSIVGRTILLMILAIVVLLILTFFCALPKIYKNIEVKTGELLKTETYAGVDFSTDKTKVYLQGNLAKEDEEALVASVKDIFAVSSVEYRNKDAEEVPPPAVVDFVLDKRADVVALEGKVSEDTLVDMASEKLKSFKLSNKLTTDKNLPEWWGSEALNYLLNLPKDFDYLNVKLSDADNVKSLNLNGKLNPYNEDAKDQVLAESLRDKIIADLNTRFADYLDVNVNIILPEQSKTLYGAKECQDKIDEHLQKNPILFDRSESLLKTNSKLSLDVLASIIAACEADLKFEVAGHADSRGNDGINVPLSKNRAQAALKYLVNAAKVDSGKLNSKGYSSNAPVATNGTEEGRQLNRRVELKINN